MRTIRNGAPVIDLTALSFEDQVKEYTLRSLILPKELPSKAVSVRYMYYKGVRELAEFKYLVGMRGFYLAA